MHKSLPLGTIRCLAANAVVLLAVMPAVLWVSSVHAAQSSSQFDVLINLQASSWASNAVLCRSSTQIGPFGDAVTVICSSGEIIDFSGDTATLPWSTTQADAYRFVTLTPKSSESMGTINTYAGLGPVSSWRRINLANLNYLELTISW